MKHVHVHGSDKSFYLKIKSRNPLRKIGVGMKVQLIHSSLNFTQNIPECMTVVGTCLKGSHFNVNLLNTAQQVIDLEIKLSHLISQLINT